MPTINANLHRVMSDMHKIKHGQVTKQPIFGKRSVVPTPLEAHYFDR